MTDKIAKIDEIEFPLSSCSPFEFAGVHSGRELPGIDIDITVYSDVDFHQVEELLQKDTVGVQDPFTARQYKATLTKKSSGYQEGNPARWYRFEVKELDEAKRFAQVEIEGQRFHVLRNIEDFHHEVIGIHILLRLSPDEFVQFHSLLKPGPVEIQRIGIDESPIVRRFGGAQYWSSHKEDSQEFYKQIVRFYPIDSSTGRVGIASGHEQIAQSQMILALSARYEALVRMLMESGQLSQENGEALMSGEWQGLIDDEREVMLRSRLTEVRDAHLELD